MKKLKITDNLALKLLALFVAIILWIAVVNINDAVGTVRYTLGVELRNTNVITDNGKVFRVEEGTDTVRVTVRARRSVLEKLEPSDFTLVADMEKDLKFDSLVGITVECKNKHIAPDEDVSLSRTNVKVSIEDSATEHFPVTVKAVGNKNSGMEIGSMVPEQTIIKISGPVSIIDRIKRVEAEVDVTGIPATTVKNCALKILDGNGEEMDTAYLNYAGKKDGINVTVTMLNTKTLTLNFSYTGTPAEHYNVTGITCKPEVVTVAGNEKALVDLTVLEIPAEAIDIEGIHENLQQIIDLKKYLPSGVTLPDENDASVLVTVSVEYVAPPQEQTEGENNASDDEGGENNQNAASGNENNSSHSDGNSSGGDSSETEEGTENKKPDTGNSQNEKPSGNKNEQQTTENQNKSENTRDSSQ